MVATTAMGQVRWGACLLLALVAGVGGLRAEIKTDPNLPADTAAVVNGQAIPRHLVDVFLKNDREALGLDPARDADRARLAGLPAAILEELVQRALIAQETQRRGIEPTPGQLDAEEKRLVEFCGNDARYAAYVEQNGFDRRGYRDYVLRPAA
ncbi:MAG: SurA N-terminal domain-containing protein, partial [Rhodospirillales bacterium]|nr:SurA N-terminal domain-containing protein [Acetobacter sp.]